MDVLWRKGDADAAFKLEMLWNELLEKYSFSLMCGYAMDPFFAQPACELVFAQHTHVHTPAAV